MAYPDDNGDVTSIKELGHFDLPGAGHTRLGAASNNKSIRWGTIVGTFLAAGIALDRFGEDGRPFGLDELDHVSIECTTAGAASAIYPTSGKGIRATINVNNKIFICDTQGADTPVRPTDGDVITFNYVAFGSTYTSPELV